MTVEQDYLREVQYRHPDRLKSRALLHTRYGRGDWFAWLANTVRLPSGATVADIGCGAGAYWINAPSSVPDDLALRLFDLSPGMVDEAARAVAALKRWTDLRAEVADAVAIPLETASVDVVLAIHMLYHVADPARGAIEFARLLKPDGTAAVVLNPAGAMAELSALVDKALGRGPERRSEPLTSEQAAPLLHAAFGSVEMVRFHDELVVTEPVDLLAYLFSLPIADAPGAQHALAEAVASAFATAGEAFRISKAADLFICRQPKASR